MSTKKHDNPTPPLTAHEQKFEQILQKKLHYTFKNPDLLRAACHVKSMGERRRNMHFERLEFLGDRVLGLSMADILTKAYPHAAEGELAKKLSALVSKASCQNVAQGLHLQKVLEHYARGKPLHSNALSDGVEAILGAIMCDSSFDDARNVVTILWKDYLSGETSAPKDPKTYLQEYTQKHFQTVPDYTILERTGPDHAPHFKLSITVCGPLSKKLKVWTTATVEEDQFYVTTWGDGETKRQAEHKAAENFLKNYIRDPLYI